MIKQKSRIMSLLAIVVFIALLYVYPALAKSILDSASTLAVLGTATTANNIGPPVVNGVNEAPPVDQPCTFTYDTFQEIGILITDPGVCCFPWTALTGNYGTIKVTGGGQISVPDPNSNDPNAIGTGSATFGFNAQPDKNGAMAKNNFNYVNHVTGLHVKGQIDKIEVIAKNLDSSPKIFLFYGTSSDCSSFIVTIKDKGEPGTSDQFGIMVTGSQSEVRSMRVISNGNIQFHE